MWQVLLGIYFIVAILVAVLLWSSLVLAKRSDQHRRDHAPSSIDISFQKELSSISKQAYQLPALSELSKK